MVSGSTTDWPMCYVAITLVGLPQTGRGPFQQYDVWVLNGPADVVSSYMVSRSTTGRPRSYLTAWLVTLEWMGPGHIQLHDQWVYNRPAEVISSYIICRPSMDQLSLYPSDYWVHHGCAEIISGHLILVCSMDRLRTCPKGLVDRPRGYPAILLVYNGLVVVFSSLWLMGHRGTGLVQVSQGIKYPDLLGYYPLSCKFTE